MSKLIEHTPHWMPGPLVINEEGDTRPGWWCIHLLENGNGPCGGNVFELKDAVGTHACLVRDNA